MFNKIKVHLFKIPLVRRLKSVVDIRLSSRKGSFAQHGEDVYILDLLGPSGFYVDVGASHPHQLSNTFGLYKAGWKGITVEPIRGYFVDHKNLRKNDIQVNAGVGRTDGGPRLFRELSPRMLSTFDADTADGYLKNSLATEVETYEVPIRSVSSILDEHGSPSVDLLSVDVEGLELAVLQGIDFARHKPTVIIIEMSSPLGSHKGATAAAELLQSKGYELLCKLGANDVFRLA